MMKYFTKINRDTCIACGSCAEYAPDIFSHDEEGLSFSLLDNNKGVTEIPDSLIPDLEDAFDECPTSSILIEHAPFVTEDELQYK